MKDHHINMIEFIEHGDKHVALYDDRDLNEEDAKNIFMYEGYSPYMIIMSKQQYEHVFRSLKGE